jgi:hypothetical protein
MKKESKYKDIKLRSLILFLLPVGILIVSICCMNSSDLIRENLRNGFSKPLLRVVCTAASKVDFSGRNIKYISREDLREIKKNLRPGDIIFRRNEDQLTNIAISGFWTHSGIYIGGRDEINKYFGELKTLNGKKPSEYIEQKYPGVFRKLILRHNMIIEAIGDGVTISSIDHFANADYFSAIRPDMDKENIFRILLAAFNNYGKPYDFLFDSLSDDSFFCSELVYKSLLYAGCSLHFNKLQLTNGSLITPNDIALQIINADSIFHFVIFYCADEKMEKAYKKNKEEFAIYVADK